METPADKQRAQQLYKQLSKDHPRWFAYYTDPEFALEYKLPHSQYIFDKFYQSITGDLFQNSKGKGLNIVVLSLPPGHYKTSILNKCVAWYVAHNYSNKKPHQVGMVSYNATVAESNSRTVIDLFAEQRFIELFPDVKLSKKSASVSQWRLAGVKYGDTCRAVGTGGALTGHRTHLLVIDDPVKDAVEAYSPADREKKWNWWKTVARTRCYEGRSVVFVVLTRWHHDDLAGKIIAHAHQFGDNVVVLRVPALAETDKQRSAVAKMGLPIDPTDPLDRQPGEALAPHLMSANYLRAYQKGAPIEFASMYQGKPRPESGFLANRSLFQRLPVAPSTNIRWVWGTDWAITAKETAKKGKNDPDYTVVGRIGLWTPDGDLNNARIVIADVKRGQLNMRQAKQMVKHHILTYHAPVYAGQAHIDSIAINDLQASADLITYYFKVLSRSEMPGDKVSRSKIWLEDRLYGGLVYVVDGDWNEPFFDEVEQFPHGDHDDQIDMVSVGVHALGLGLVSQKAISSHVNFYS